MQLDDERRKRLAKIATIQNASHRDLAKAAGYKSHSYISRLLRGEVTTLTPEAAIRIAAFLGVGVDDLFLPRTSTKSGHSERRTSAA